MAEHWIEGVIGLWILLSPWLMGYANLSLAKWSSVASGLALIIINLWSLLAKEKGEGI